MPATRAEERFSTAPSTITLFTARRPTNHLRSPSRRSTRPSITPSSSARGRAAIFLFGAMSAAVKDIEAPAYYLYRDDSWPIAAIPRTRSRS